MSGYDKERQYYDRFLPVYLLKVARSRAKEKGLECTIKATDIIVPDLCPIMGIKLGRARGAFDRASPSLDRIDSSKGYVPGNVRVISWIANKLKNDMTLDQVRNLVLYMEGKI
jgi:hypothetical protein